MAHSPALHQQGKQAQQLKQTQRLMVSPQMQQAILILQMSVLELEPFIKVEVENNPLLDYQEDGEQSDDSELQRLEEAAEEESQEIDDGDADREVTFDDNDFDVLRQLSDDYYDHFDLADTPYQGRDSQVDKLRIFQESTITANESLYEHLMKQMEEQFSSPQQQHAAQLLIGNFDANGFLATPLDEIAHTHTITVKTLEILLATIQTFDPQGVGARNLQESLLIQLRQQGKESSLAYAIIADHYDALLQNKMRPLSKKLGCTTNLLTSAIHDDIFPLNLHPGLEYSRDLVPLIGPDLSIHEESDGTLTVHVHDDRVPSLHLNYKYLRMLQDKELPTEAKEFIKKKVLGAKWLLRSLYQRNETLEKVAASLVRRQHAFFSERDGPLVPMTMKVVAEELGLHESTIARAVANKYADSDRGLIPLRSLFTNAYNTADGKQISSKTVRELLQEIVANEDKEHPFSDQKISDAMKKRGITCARRTIAKYRRSLQIGNAHQRRRY